MATTDWNDDWNDPTYVWPVTSVPEADVVERLNKRVIALDGRAVSEAHADRSVLMEFPNGAAPGTRIRKQVPRAECRRRVQVMMPLPPDSDPAPDTAPRQNNEPLKVCVVCDGVDLWPVFDA